MRKASGSSSPLGRLAVGLLLFTCVHANASEPDLSKMVADVAAEPWPHGKMPAGSGFFVGRRGEVMTAAHVIAGCRRIAVQVNGSLKLKAVLVGLDARLDIALLRVAIGPHSVLEFAGTAPLMDAALTVVTRSAQTGRFLRVAGRVVGKDDRGLLKVDVALSPGASGSAVIDSRGLVAAYIVGRMGDKPAIALAVPVDSLGGFLRYFNSASMPMHSRTHIAGGTKTLRKSGSLTENPAVVATECLK
jgi:S1-C subfamily serine protease